MSIVLLLICRFSLVFSLVYSAGSGVRKVHVVFSVLRMRLFAGVHTWMLFKFVCVVEIVMSSVYVMICCVYEVVVCLRCIC